MIFDPKYIIKTDGDYVLGDKESAVANKCLSDGVFHTLWRGFTFEKSELVMTEGEELVFRIGDAERLPLDGYAYTVNVEEKGVCVYAENTNALIWGFMALLDRITPVDNGGETQLLIGGCQIKDAPTVDRRGVHFCVFPETELWELQRFVRLCGVLRYTHIILEFWGMLKFDCMKELSWERGFTKEQIAPIIREARALGLEVIPMFNHWGHASACRVASGKHVVLDQAPLLQTYFSEDGWCWNIEAPKVRELLRAVRRELIELCGDGEYFHIGCDEAYNFDLTQKKYMDLICDYINEVSAELAAEGRRAIVWGDMFLYRYQSYDPQNRYSCNAALPECEEYMLSRLCKSVIIADWQYNAKVAPVETSAVFTRRDFDCMLCPWDRGIEQMNACVTTVKEQKLFGLIHTTWHTLSKGMPYVTTAAVESFDGELVGSIRSHRPQTASVLRKIYPAGGEYERSGWARAQISDITV